MTHISHTIWEMFARGALPATVQDARTGQRLVWSDSERAYLVPGGRWVVWAGTVRRSWGVLFGPVKARRERGELHVA